MREWCDTPLSHRSSLALKLLPLPYPLSLPMSTWRTPLVLHQTAWTLSLPKLISHRSCYNAYGLHLCVTTLIHARFSLCESSIIGPAATCRNTGKLCTSEHLSLTITAPPSLDHILHPDLDDRLSLLCSCMIMARLTWLFSASSGGRDTCRIMSEMFNRRRARLSSWDVYINSAWSHSSRPLLAHKSPVTTPRIAY